MDRSRREADGNDDPAADTSQRPAASQPITPEPVTPESVTPESVTLGLGQRIAELERELASVRRERDHAVDDLRNAMSGCRVAAVFVDKQWTVRSFTPTIRSIYDLRVEDIGRSLDALPSKCRSMPPLDVCDVAAGGWDQTTSDEPHDAIVVTDRGESFVRRVRPYIRGSDHQDGEHQDGWVVTFTAASRLAEGEQRMAEVLDASSDGMWDWNVASGEIFWSDAWLSGLGYTREDIEPFDAPIEFWKSIVHPDDIEANWRCVEDHLRGETDVYLFENRLRRKSGDYRANRVRGRVIGRDADGRPTRMVGIDTDITAETSAQRELDLSRRRLRTLADTLPPRIAVLDAGRRVEFVNRAYVEHHREPFDSIVGRDLVDVVGGETYESIEPHLCRAFSGQRVEFDTASHPPKAAANDADAEPFDWSQQHRHEHHTFVPQHADDGTVMSVQWLISDATENFLRQQTFKQLNSLNRIVSQGSIESEYVADFLKSLREHLQASRVCFVELDASSRWANIKYQSARPGNPDVIGRVRLDQVMSFQDASELAAGRQTVIADIETEVRGERQRKRYRDMNVRSFCHTSYEAGPDFRFGLAVHRDRPSRWNDIELKLIRDASDVLGLRIARSRREAEVTRRESQLRRIIDNQLGMVCVLDHDGRLIEVNATPLYAGGLTRDEVIGKRFWECPWFAYDREVADRLRESFDDAVSGRVVRYDMVARMAGDTRMPIDFMLVPICEAGGTVSQVIASGVDIAERKTFEGDLERSREDLRLAIGVANFGLGRIDYANNEIHLDETAAGIYGFGDQPVTVTRDEMHRRFHHEDDAKIKRHLAEMLQSGHGGLFAIEHRVHHGDDTRWLAVRKQIFVDDDGEPTYGVLAARDITEVKANERSIKLSEQRLRLAAESAGFGTLHADIAAGTTTFSTEALQLLGLPADEPLVVPLDEMPSFVHPDDRDAVARHYREHMTQSGDAPPIEHRALRADGSIRWVRLQARALESRSPLHRGKVSEIIGTLMDITESRDREVKLRDAMRRAEAANQSKSAFLANMSHEIRTPMTAILGYIDLVAERVEDIEARNHIQTIRSNGGFLLAIINDILDLSKIEAGKFNIVAEQFDPVRLVEDVRSIMEVRATERDLDLKVVYEGKLPRMIETDPKRLKQILINLVGNAVKFTRRGSVKIVVSHSGPATGGKMRMEVIDTGIGMTPDQQENLFKPFTQGDETVSRSFGGTGLGLTISRRLAKMLGGDIEVQSQLDRGSRFSVWVDTGTLGDVPFARPNPVVIERDNADAQADCGANDPPLKSRRILIADDRGEIRFLSKHILTRAGAVVEEAEDGRQCVDVLERMMSEGRVPDAIILDMQMPNMDGYQTAATIRAMGFGGTIIALTADAMQGDMSRCIDAGCDDYLSKPIDAQRMVSLVHQSVQPS